VRLTGHTQACVRGLLARRRHAAKQRALFDTTIAGDAVAPAALMGAVGLLMAFFGDGAGQGDAARLLRVARLVMPATGDRSPLQTYASLALHRGASPTWLPPH